MAGSVNRVATAAVVIVALIVTVANPASFGVAATGRDLKQAFTNPLGSLLGTVASLVGGLPLGPTLTYTVGGLLSQVSITSKTLSGSFSIELIDNTPSGFYPAPNTPKTGPFLYVWNAYGNSYTDPYLTPSKDFLATIDLNPNSPTYLQVIDIEPVPISGNEPHHISVSYDRTLLLGTGLLSFLKLQDDHYLFDIATDPRTPKFLKSRQLVKTAVADHVYGLSDGTFLTTQMGSKIGGSPGSVTIFSQDLTKNTSYPLNPPSDFDPHGADVKRSANLLLTSDFILPVSTVTGQIFTLVPPLPIANLLNPLDLLQTGIIPRETVRVFDLNDLRYIKKTITLAGAKGVIDVKIIPGNNPRNLAYATGVFGNGLYLVDPTAGTASRVIDFLPNDVHPHLLAPANADGTRFFLTLNKGGYFLLLDTTVPAAPKILDALYLGAGSAPHYITPIGDGKRVAVADYFLDQGIIGKVHARGNRKVLVVAYNDNGFDLANTVSFGFIGLNGRPHGIATNIQYTDVEN